MLSNQCSALITILIILIAVKGSSTARGGKWQSGLISLYQPTIGYRGYSSNYCPQLDIANGFVRNGRRTARFRCLRNYTLIGDPVVHCYGGEWSGVIPVCAAAGCLKFPSPKQGTIKKSSRDLYVTINCNPGYSLDGPSTVYCDGHYWNVSYISVTNMCKKSLSNPSTWCGFESHDQCGWSSDDPDRVTIEGPHTFGYRPYGLTLSDHTGTGHMLVVWSAISGQSNQDSINRLYSPVYDTKESESCFTFWYHLGGYDKLTDPPPFKVYIKPESMQLSDVTPWVFVTSPEAYGQWTPGQVYIPKLLGDWQIVLEFNVWQKVYGLDDLFIDRNVTKCATRSIQTSTSGISNGWTSCKDKCSTEIKGSSCSCVVYCIYLDNCCPDYEIYCSSNSTKDDDDFPDFDKILSNETTSSLPTSVWIPYTKTTTTPLPFRWIFTEYPLLSSTRQSILISNQSKIYFPIDSAGSTKVATITTSSTTSKPTIKTTSAPLISSKSNSTALTTKATVGTSVVKIDSTTELVPVNSTTFKLINRTIEVQDSHQREVNKTASTAMVLTVNFTLNATEGVYVNQSALPSSAINDSIVELRSLNSEKAELSVQETSSMETISILIGLFMIVSLVGVVFLWQRHRKYLGSSVSADSELRFLAHEDD